MPSLFPSHFLIPPISLKPISSVFGNFTIKLPQQIKLFKCCSIIKTNAQISLFWPSCLHLTQSTHPKMVLGIEELNRDAPELLVLEQV